VGGRDLFSPGFVAARPVRLGAHVQGAFVGAAGDGTFDERGGDERVAARVSLSSGCWLPAS